MWASAASSLATFCCHVINNILPEWTVMLFCFSLSETGTNSQDVQIYCQPYFCLWIYNQLRSDLNGSAKKIQTKFRLDTFDF